MSPLLACLMVIDMGEVISWDVKLWKEKDFQNVVIHLAHMFGWWVYHTHDSRRSQPGFPDLVLIREPEIIYVELKTEKGQLSAEQNVVIGKLNNCGQETYVWRPRHLDDIKTRLSRKELLCSKKKDS